MKKICFQVLLLSSLLELQSHALFFPSLPPLAISNSGSASSNKKSNKKGGSGGHNFLQSHNKSSSTTGASNRKWEQKQVQIKTLEGEFSVTMWASGTEDDDLDNSFDDDTDMNSSSSQHSQPQLDISEYMSGVKKIPKEGIPGVDLSDPKQLAELTK